MTKELDTALARLDAANEALARGYASWLCPGCDQPMSAPERPRTTTDSYCSTLCWALDHDEDWHDDRGPADFEPAEEAE